jgi:riboflavin kinase/FMN adenylyltransferase
MKIYRSLAGVPRDFAPSALTIGNFDGVHYGHRQILRRVKAIAAEHGWKPSVLTFDPHPTRVVAPDRTPPLLTTPDARADLMREEGIEQVLILPFTLELAHLSPEDFVTRILVDTLGARAVLVGDNFRFGHKHAGNVALLTDLGRKLGFTVEIVPAVTCRGQIVSSTGVRDLIRAGRVDLAARFLCHPYALEGTVISGRGVGSKQTVPTLNLATTAEVLPATGVYITRTHSLPSVLSASSTQKEEEQSPTTLSPQNAAMEQPAPSYPAPVPSLSLSAPSSASPRLRVECLPQASWNSITNIGYRPTFGDTPDLSIETFLLDPLTGPTPQHIRVEFLRRVRAERKFDSPEALRVQILKDVAAANRYFRRRKAWTGRQCISC